AISADIHTPIATAVGSRARGNRAQARQLMGFIGRIVREDLHASRLFISNSFLDGLEPLEYWTLAHSTRRVMIDKRLGTAFAGELTRALVEGAYEYVVTGEDCGT